MLANQSLVETFGHKDYNQINGDLNIGSLQNNLTDVRDLSVLQSIIDVKRNLSIRNTACTTLNGLQKISTTYKNAIITIDNNDDLLNRNGLNSIRKVYDI